MKKAWLVPGAGTIIFLTASPLTASPTQFDVPAGTVGQAALVIGRQAGISVALPEHAVAARKAKAVRGRMEPADALRRIAKSAGLSVRPLGPAAFLLLNAPPPPVLRRQAPTAVAPARTKLPIQAAEPTEDIIVTASKRDTPLFRFAGLWSRVSASELQGWGVLGSEAIEARVVGLSSTHLGAGRNKLFIRGIADSSFSGPTQSPVGQYVGDVRTGYSGPDPDLRLVDVNSVEVLEGPQGTLYGSGAIGGIFLVKPNAPEMGRTGGSVSVGATATEHGRPGYDAAAMVNLSPNARSALRIVGYRVTEGGYIDNITTGRRDINRVSTSGARVAGRVEVAPEWTLDLAGAAQRIRGEDSQYADVGAPPLSRIGSVAQPFGSDFSLGSVVLGKNDGAVRFRSIVAVTDQKTSENFDAAPSSLKRLHQKSDAHAISSETRIWRPMDGGYSWLLGVSMLSHRYHTAREGIGDTAVIDLAGVTNVVKETTVYGEAAAALLPSIELSAGGRYTRSSLVGWGHHLPALPALRMELLARRREDRFLPSASLLARPLKGLSLYARVQTGFRPGGLTTGDDSIHYYRSDSVTTIEGGFKIGVARRDPFDLQLGVSRSRWSNIQADYIDARGLPSTANIGDGRVRSISLNAGAALTQGLRAEAGFAWNDGRITRQDAGFALLAGIRSDMRIPNIARVVARGALDWTQELGPRHSVSATSYVRYVGRSRVGVGPRLGRSQGDYLDTGLSVRITDGARAVSLTATNLTDEIGNRFALGTPMPVGGDQVTPLRPRSIRLGLEASF